MDGILSGLKAVIFVDENKLAEIPINNDVTRQVIVLFTIVKKKGIYTLKSNLELNRLDYGLGEESIIIGDEVNILLK